MCQLCSVSLRRLCLVSEAANNYCNAVGRNEEIGAYTGLCLLLKHRTVDLCTVTNSTTNTVQLVSMLLLAKDNPLWLPVPSAGTRALVRGSQNFNPILNGLGIISHR